MWMLGHAVVNVENACASGSTAVHLARKPVESGSADAALVLGVEKMTGMFQGGISLGRTDRPTQIGLTMPAVYALWAHRYAEVYGISTDELAKVAVKNRAHGARNPLAMFQKEVSVAEVLESKPIADPLTLLPMLRQQRRCRGTRHPQGGAPRLDDAGAGVDPGFGPRLGASHQTGYRSGSLQGQPCVRGAGVRRRVHQARGCRHCRDPRCLHDR